MLDQADHRDAEENDDGQGEGDDDMAGDGEGIGQQAQEVAGDDEHKQRKDEGEILAPLGSHVFAQHVGDEFVAQLGDRLPAAGHHGAAPHAKGQQRRHQHQHDHHHQRRIGERDIQAGDIDFDQALDLELRERAVLFRHRT